MPWMPLAAAWERASLMAALMTLGSMGKAGTQVTKASRRDLAVLCARGQDGATTVTTTMIIAHTVGLQILQGQPQVQNGLGPGAHHHHGGGDSLDSNIQLVFNNARLAARTAVCLTK